MRRNIGHRSSIGNNMGGSGPLMTGHLQDIDLELELLKRKREMIEQQQQLLVMEQQFKTSRHYDSYDQPRYHEPDHGSNRDFTHLYDNGPKHRNQVGRKRQAEVQWQYDGSSKRTQQKRKSNQSQLNQQPAKTGPTNFRNQRPPSGPNQGSKSSPKVPAPLMGLKIKQSIGQKIANQKPSPKGNKEFTLAKSFKPKASQPSNKISSVPLVDRKSLVSAAKEGGSDVSRMLLPDRVPTQQVSGRLELALGAIMKNIRTLVPNESRHATMLRSIQLQRVMKQAVRERIRTVMLGKVVGSLLDILAIYREEFPEETDMDIVNIALEAAGISTQEKPKKIKVIESEDPGKFFKINMSYLIETKLTEMFDKLQEIYGNPLAAIGSKSKAINSEATTSGTMSNESTNIEAAIKETTNTEASESETTDIGTANAEETDGVAANTESNENGAANTKPTDDGAANTDPTDVGVANTESTDHGVANTEPTDSEATNTEPADNGVANTEPIDSEADNTGPTDSEAANGEATNTGVTDNGANKIETTDSRTSNAVSGAQDESENYVGKQVKREDSEEFHKFLDTEIKVRDIRGFLPRIMKRYIPYMIKLMNLDAMYLTTKAAVTMKANQKAANIFNSNNKAPAEDTKNSEKTIDASENSNQLRPAYNLPYYVKIMGIPTLPKRKVMQTFLNQFNPKSIKKHRTIHNLLFVGFTEKSDFDVMVGADGTLLGRSKLSVRICTKGAEGNPGQNGGNNDSNFAMDITQDEVKKESSMDGDIITAELDNQITDLLSSIRKSEEADSKDDSKKTGDEESNEVKAETVAEGDKADAENTDKQSEAVGTSGETPDDENTEAGAKNAEPSADTMDTETAQPSTDTTKNENSEGSIKKDSTSEETAKGDDQQTLEENSKTEEQPEDDKVTDLKTNVSGRSTPSRMSTRLANVTPSTIRTRRASRLAQN